MAARRLPWRSVRRAMHQYSGIPDLPQNRVAILGACGSLGQPLALMLKRSAFVAELALYDLRETRGICVDLSHIATKALVSGYRGPDQLPDCLRNSSVVIMLAGTPRRPGMHRDDLFELNAGTVADLTAAVAQHCPEAQLCVLTSPLNSNVPLAADILRRHGAYDPRRLFGVTAIDSVRANILTAQRTGAPLDKVNVPVIGGHSGTTLVPLFSQMSPHSHLESADVRALTHALRGAADAVVAAKAGAGSAALSVSAATHKFVHSLLCAMDGRPDIVEPAFVESDVVDGVSFCSSPLVLGLHGVQRNPGIGRLSEFEADLLHAAVRELRGQIEKGRRFAESWRADAAPFL